LPGSEPPLGPAEQPAGSAHPRYPRLFSPLRVGPIDVKNRIVNSAHTTNYARDGVYTEQLIAYHRERARGGAAIIVSQATNVIAEYGELYNADESIIPWYRRVAEAVQPYGAKYFAELSYPGRQGDYSGFGAEVYNAPSAVPGRHYERELRIPHVLEPDEIRRIIAAFGAAAGRCRAGGLDGIELHFAHGNLAQQFLSPLTNRREDEWGGSLDNRLRFAREVARAAREQAGPGLVVGCRFTGAELEPGGLQPDEVLEMAGRLDAEGLLDYFSVTMGHYSDLLNTARNMPDMHFRPGLWSGFGAAMKRAARAPVFVVGRIVEPGMAERLIEEGQCDMVVLARALVADAELPIKAFDGHESRIRTCVGAQDGCWGRVGHGHPMRCVQNPVTGREEVWSDRPPRAAASRRVVVVGGGPAGLESARVAAERGHRVTLLERDATLGGQVRLAARAPRRGELARMIEWLERECARLGVEVRLGAEVRAEDVLALEPEAVVVATGATPGRLAAERADGVAVVDAWTVLAGRASVGRRALVIDTTGQREGFSVAGYLAEAGHEVELVTPMIYPGQNIEPSGWRTTYQQLLEQGVRFRALTEVTRLSADGATLRHVYTNAEEVVPPVDTVVTALAADARDTLYRALQGKVARLDLIGDARAPRGFEQAYYEGQAAAREIE
jgi:2,4-dienoyl-CoA reductase-like NADH-dependent reductase (Old Yellow Enzyme family)/thioredoxin reductase